MKRGGAPGGWLPITRFSTHQPASARVHPRHDAEPRCRLPIGPRRPTAAAACPGRRGRCRSWVATDARRRAAGSIASLRLRSAPRRSAASFSKDRRGRGHRSSAAVVGGISASVGWPGRAERRARDDAPIHGTPQRGEAIGPRGDARGARRRVASTAKAFRGSAMNSSTAQLFTRVGGRVAHAASAHARGCDGPDRRPARCGRPPPCRSSRANQVLERYYGS
jgi:hypothetical protein